MEEKKTSLFENGLIWFGAAMSLAELLTGTYFASLGFSKGVLAIVVGHIIGCTLLFLAGCIGGKTRKNAMETVGISFGMKGSTFFAILNVLQLFGWTSIMVYNGSLAANAIWDIGSYIWCIVIGILVLIWILVGVTNLGKLNTFAMGALFILTIILSFVVFGDTSNAVDVKDTLSFGAAVELAVAMPLSWLPLISDYTKEAKEPVKASAVSAITYGLVGCWMFIIGMGMTIFTGESDIATIVLRSGLTVAGLCIVVLSTVVTTFMDAYSAGASTQAIFKNINSKTVGVFTIIVGVTLAIAFPMDNLSNFLYLIGSVFAPMIAVLLTDYYILKNDFSTKLFDVKNIAVWFVGFIIYRLLMNVDIVVGNTLPAMIITSVLVIAVDKIAKKTN